MMGSNKRIIKCFRFEGELWRASKPVQPLHKAELTSKLNSAVQNRISLGSLKEDELGSTAPCSCLTQETKYFRTHLFIPLFTPWTSTLLAECSMLSSLHKQNFSYINLGGKKKKIISPLIQQPGLF